MTVREQIEQIAGLLPVPVYLVDEGGRFLYANDRLRRLFAMSQSEVSDYNIGDFYADRPHRAALVDKVRRQGELIKEIVTFTSGDRNIQVQMSCNPVENERGEFLGYFGVLVEVTEEAQYHSVFDAHLPAGVYRLDNHDRVTQANLGFANLHGYASADDIIGRPATDFYADANEAAKVTEEILQQREINKRKVKLRRKNGQMFAAYVTAVAFFDRHDNYAGRAGVIEDRTVEEQYERLSQDIPVGFYIVHAVDDKDLVVDCNEEFARIFDLPSRAAMLRQDLRDFHFSPQETAALMEKLKEAAARGGTVLGEHFRIRTAHGAVKTIEVNARPQTDGEVIVGRTGAIRDITEEVEMRDRITALTNDIGAVLHTFRHTLTQLKHNISSVADILAGAPNTTVRPQTADELEEEIRPPLHELSVAVDRFVTTTANVTHAVALEKKDREDLLRAVGVMNAYRTRNKAHWRATWIDGAARVLAICKRIRPNTVARDAYRPMILAAERIGVLTGLATLSIAREAIAAVDTPLESLYGFVIGRRNQEAKEVVSLESCVTEAINSLADFANERGVGIRFDGESRHEVYVRRVEVTRAIQNLLHNAIKYSWARGEKRPWVSIIVTINERAMVEVAVENWGVPIPQEEIQKGLVFRLGFRGRLSSDRGRLGTGVGLADSLSVAKTLGGSLTIESRPAAPMGNPREYDKPFITTARIALPPARNS